VVMPQMSGPALAKRLAALRPTMKILFMSGFTDDAVVRHGLLQGETPFIQKPFTPETPTRKVREVLDSSTCEPGRAGVWPRDLASVLVSASLHRDDPRGPDHHPGASQLLLRKHAGDRASRRRHGPAEG
jgi:DNA-binding NarL/FixJ family response regulator